MTNPLPDPHHLCGDCRTRLDRITQLRTEADKLERIVAECNAVTGRYDPSPLVDLSTPAAQMPERLRHLAADAPGQRCSRCERWTWATREFNKVCGMPQPDGSVCDGYFQATARSATR